MDALTAPTTWSVYALVDPRDEQVRYVGKSVAVETRIKAHLRDRSATRKARWVRALQREGRVPEVLILETGAGDWQGAEVKWIAYFRAAGCDLTNATSGGEGLHNPTEETRERIGANQRAIWDDPVRREQRLAMYATVEWREAVGASLRGKAKTAAHVAALPQNRSDYPWSDEVRAARRACLIQHAQAKGWAAPRTQAQVDHLRSMSESNRGKPGWARGRVLSDAERRVRSVAQVGRPKSEEHKEKIRQAALRRWARVRSEKEQAS